ncbi:hypothetical protein QFC21_006806 [Naganishia friedmannii]|uniref:Uncharacterized protein n=1 Tax=Naganishia friedmannii TaxID=89922 RepID=A0ACC2UZC8_9TREE|nr:hypothetical protein QFC21_006806 [Naganishia friedmannii]
MANDNEQQFTIQPHPAKTNNPADLTQDPSGRGGLLGTNPNALVGGVATGPGLQVLSDEQARGLEKPKGREELDLVVVEECEEVDGVKNGMNAVTGIR